MDEKFRKPKQHYDEIQRQLCDPLISSDIEKVTALSKELKSLEPFAVKYAELERAEKILGDTLEMIDDPDCDPELKELARSELDGAKAAVEKAEGELKILLLPRDPNDDRNVIVEIRSGTGGEESALFAGSLYRMYTMYSARMGYKTEVVSCSETQLGGFKEMIFTVSGSGAYSRFKFESGVHRVQRVPETESQGRIQTSAATVAVFPEAEDVDVTIDPADLQIDTFCSSGAGGQKVNKTSSAIRITHIPTGLVVECQDERSQYRNKDKAMAVLRSRLLAAERQKQSDSIAGERRNMVGSGDRSERIRTYNFPQGRVTDHRIGLTLYKIESIMNGDIDELIDALITADTAAKLGGE
ncbi:MAG: peptide chain release factor 1 [Clostridia bacterium]|nr:peptide chain release factor 1 [Clostridia bacterium]